MKGEEIMSQDFKKMAEEIVRQSSELSDDALSSAIAAALAQVCEAERSAHCKDCCCARSWEALGVNSYTGMSIVEHIEQLRAKLAAAENSAREQFIRGWYAGHNGIEDEESMEARYAALKAGKEEP